MNKTYYIAMQETQDSPYLILAETCSKSVAEYISSCYEDGYRKTGSQYTVTILESLSNTKYAYAED